MHTLLLVNSNPAVLKELEGVFKPKGFQILTSMDADGALTKAKELLPAVILTDIELKNSDGIFLCKKIRETPSLFNSSVVFYSQQNENFYQIAAFKAGADDFITPPISSVLLLLKLQVLLNRSRDDNKKQNIYRVNGIIVDKEKHQVKVADKEVGLPKKEFEILELLISDPQKVFTREEMKDKIWGNGVIVRNRTIDVHIRKLRERIGDRLIITVKGVGYKFNVN